MVLVYTHTPVPSNYYVTWVENDTHLELQVLILAPYLAQYKIFFLKKKTLFSHVFYPKLFSSIQMASRIFFSHERRNHWRASESMWQPPGAILQTPTRSRFWLSPDCPADNWPPCWPSPPLTQSCSPPLCACPVLDCSDPDERKSCEQIWVDRFV